MRVRASGEGGAIAGARPVLEGSRRREMEGGVCGRTRGVHGKGRGGVEEGEEEKAGGGGEEAGEGGRGRGRGRREVEKAESGEKRRESSPGTG